MRERKGKQKREREESSLVLSINLIEILTLILSNILGVQLYSIQ